LDKLEIEKTMQAAMPPAPATAQIGGQIPAMPPGPANPVAPPPAMLPPQAPNTPPGVMS
jgi:hypothetical protein